jgi:hypothetical protein
VFALGAVLCGTHGCAYVQNRARDARQMLDIGITWSKKPQFGLYGNCPLVTPVGYSNVDGYYAGLGGGKLGVMKHTQKNTGLLVWGRERNSWDDSSKHDPTTEEDHGAGVLGIADGLSKGEQAYKPACIHYLHLGWVGVTGNARYYEMFDFAAGLVGFDPSGDDRGGAATSLAAARSGAATSYPLKLVVP